MDTAEAPREAVTRKYTFKPSGSSQVAPESKRKCSIRELVMLALVVVLIAALVVLIVLLVQAKNVKESTSSHLGGVVCDAAECVAEAASINSFIDDSVDPCDDFYQFACGQWLKKSTVPPDSLSITSFKAHHRQVEVDLKNLLEAEGSTTEWASISKAKMFYKTCMDEDQIDYVKDTELKKILDQLGNWPLSVKDWSESQVNLTKLMANLTMLGINPLFRFFVSIDTKDSSKQQLQIDIPSLWMITQKKMDVEKNDIWFEAYHNFIEDVNKKLNFYSQSTELTNDISKQVDFEKNLAEIAATETEHQDLATQYKSMPLSYFITSYSNPDFSWKEYFDSVMSLAGMHRLTDTTVIINHSEKYFGQLMSLLSQTSKRTLVNYIIWKFVAGYSGTLGKAYDDILGLRTKRLLGVPSREERFRFCTDLTSNFFMHPVAKLYMTDKLDAQSKKVQEMLNHIKVSYKAQINEADLDAVLKMAAREKIDQINVMIGYPNIINDRKIMDEFYKEYTVDEKNFFMNFINIIKQRVIKEFRKLNASVDKSDGRFAALKKIHSIEKYNKWTISPLQSQPLYKNIGNKLVIPPGSLKAPFFNVGYPGSLNYGRFGVSLSHEIGHSVDETGLNFDRYGNLAEKTDRAVQEKFKNKQKCFTEQDKFITSCLKTSNLETKDTLNRTNQAADIYAENVALKVAYKAYSDLVKKQGKEDERLPGLKFTPEQLFFITFAQSRCEMLIKKGALFLNSIGKYNPGCYRVTGALRNSPEFAQVFSCDHSSKMNPSQKCEV